MAFDEDQGQTNLTDVLRNYLAIVSDPDATLKQLASITEFLRAFDLPQMREAMKQMTDEERLALLEIEPGLSDEEAGTDGAGGAAAPSKDEAIAKALSDLEALLSGGSTPAETPGTAPSGFPGPDEQGLTAEQIRRAQAQQTGAGGGGGGGSTSTTVQKQFEYVDVPTAEQYLDDFRNGFATYLKEISGGLGRLETMWAIDNMEIFMTDYLGALGKRGTPYKAVNTGGSYPSYEQTTTTTQGGGGGGGGAGGAGDGGHTSKTTATQEVGSRPAPGYVATLPPLTHLRNNWSPESIKLQYEAFKGTRARQSSGGGGISASRV